MGTIAASSRITAAVVAAAGQTDFAVNFPAQKYNGSYAGLYANVTHAGATTTIDLTQFDVVNPTDAGFTARLHAGATGGDTYQFFGKLPMGRDMAWSGGAFSTDIAEADMGQRVYQLQELRRDVDALMAGGVPEGGGGGGVVGSVAWSELTDIPSVWPGGVSWGAITGRPAAWPGTMPYAGLTSVPAILSALAVLTPAAGQVVEFTGPTTAHMIATPAGGGGGGSSSQQPQLLSAFSATDNTGANPTTNDAAFAAAEAAPDSTVYVPDGYFAKSAATPAYSDLTKRYLGPGRIKEGTTVLPGRFGYMAAKPTTAATQGLTGWFDGDQRFTDGGEYKIIGPGVREFDLSDRYFESNTIPHHAFMDVNSGNSGVQAWLTAGAAADATTIALPAAADASWVGKSVAFSNSEGGAALDTKTVVAVNVSGGHNIQIDSGLAHTYTWSPGTGVTPNIRFALRTWAGFHYLKLTANGGGDHYGYMVRTSANYVSKATETHPFMAATPSQFGGDVTANADNVYLQCWESQLVDQGYSTSAIAFVMDITRTNDASLLNKTWQGTFFQSVGTRPADVCHNILGFWRNGVDMAYATLYETAQITGNTVVGANLFQVSSTNGVHPNDTVQIGSEVLTIDHAAGSTISTTTGATAAHTVGELVTYSNGGAALNLARGQRIVFGSTVSAAGRGADSAGVFATPYGNKQGNLFLDSGVTSGNDYIALRIARGPSAALPDTARLRLKDDGAGNGIIQIYGTGTHTIAGLGLGFAAGCNINMSLNNTVNWGNVILKSDGTNLMVSTNGGASFRNL